MNTNKRIEIYDDDCEYLLLNAYKGEICQRSNNSFVLSVSQPLKSVFDPNWAYESEATPSVIIDSSPFGTFIRVTPDNKNTKNKRFDFSPEVYKSEVEDNNDAYYTTPTKYFSDNK